MQYIILDGKTPTHSFKNGKGKTWEEVKEFDNIAVIVPKNYIVLDFDTKSDAEIMLKIVETLGLKTRVMKTTRGIHCWFRAPEKNPKNFIKNRLAIGIYADRKAGGKNSYVKIKQDGKAREWLYKVKTEEIEIMPKWLQSVSAPGEQFRFKEMSEGSGRNQELFNYIVYLQSKGFSREEIRQTIKIINEFVFIDSLSEYEIETICRDESFKEDDVIAEQIAAANEKFKHNTFGDKLIEEYNIISVNNKMYVYDDGYYKADDKIIERKMIEKFNSITQRQRSEVLSYLKIKTYISKEDLDINPYILNLKNTRLDLRTGQKLDFTPDAIEFDRVPVFYDKDAYSKDLDKMLNKVFLGNREVIDLFEEMIGAILLKHSRYQKAFLFYGQGANGKSTILDLIKTFLGYQNYSAIALEKVTNRFNTAEIENKLANIGDDIDDVVIKDTGTLKKLFSGNAIMVERKGETPYTITPFATHIYSCNSIPKSFDKSEGFYRRWIFIPFNAKFNPTDKDYDPMIVDKITTDTALSYLLNLGIKGAQRLMKKGGFTIPACVEYTLAQYQIENSNVLSWVFDKELDIDYLLDNPRDNLYSEFCDWCKVSGISMVTGKKTFYKELKNYYNFEESTKQKHNGKRYFIMKID